MGGLSPPFLRERMLRSGSVAPSAAAWGNAEGKIICRSYCSNFRHGGLWCIIMSRRLAVRAAW